MGRKDLASENAELREALRQIARVAVGMSFVDGERHKEIVAMARDALGEHHHLTALGYGPKSRETN